MNRKGVDPLIPEGSTIRQEETYIVITKQEESGDTTD